MEPITVSTISVVIDMMQPERQSLLALLGELDDDAWALPTECPAYAVKGVAAHLLGDDLSLLSRQRDHAVQGLVLVAERMPGVDFRTLLDTFNDQWVEAARFLSPPLLIELLRLSGDWTAEYYGEVDPGSPGEPVPLFSPTTGDTSPFWHAIAREFLERWTHHAQIRRALSRSSIPDPGVLAVGVNIISTVAAMPATVPNGPDAPWEIGPMILGPSEQAAAILTLAHTEDEVAAMVDGPPALVAEFAGRVGRRT
nr:putative maleylpyruvate isomerase family mycothiol-dependent enzyme [uncultured bacterium]